MTGLQQRAQHMFCHQRCQVPAHSPAGPRWPALLLTAKQRLDGRWAELRNKPNMFLPYRPNTFDPVWCVLQVTKSRKHIFPLHLIKQRTHILPLLGYCFLAALLIPFWRTFWLPLHAALKELVYGCSQVDSIAIDASTRKHTRNSLTAWVWFKDWGTNVASIEAGRNFAPDANGSRNQSLLVFEVLIDFVD